MRKMKTNYKSMFRNIPKSEDLIYPADKSEIN